MQHAYDHVYHKDGLRHVDRNAKEKLATIIVVSDYKSGYEFVHNACKNDTLKCVINDILRIRDGTELRFTLLQYLL